MKRRELERLRQRKHRQLKLQHKPKTSTPDIGLHVPESPAFKRRQSAGKALARVKRALPQSPRKSVFVVRKLAEEHGFITSGKKTRTAATPELDEKVASFYCRDDISRQAPGKKDFVKDKKGRQKRDRKGTW